MKETKTPEELMAALAGSGDMSNGDISMEDLMTVGPGDENEPGALYRNMLQEVIGMCVRGVLWYQGESDEHHADLYDLLFSEMIQCWRNSWKEKNTDMTELPFLFVQLAPYGTWNGSTGVNYPTLREHQEIVARSVPDVWMTSISDIGNVYDIHPKYKKPVGERLEGLAEKYVYHWDEDALVEAPEAADMEKIIVDGSKLVDNDAIISIEKDTMVIASGRIHEDSKVKIYFAKTPFYQVNLYNKAEIPVKPFALL